MEVACGPVMGIAGTRRGDHPDSGIWLPSALSTASQVPFRQISMRDSVAGSGGAPRREPAADMAASRNTSRIFMGQPHFTMGPADFGAISSARDGRVMQLGLKITF